MDARSEYTTRLKAHREVAARQERLHVQAGNLKLATIGIGLLMIWVILDFHAFGAIWLLLPLAIFAALLVWHERVLQAKARAVAAENYYLRGVARMEDRWRGTGQSGERFRDENHPYSGDLDLFGTGCLFELLSTARLPMGENLLASWLRSASPLKTILDRQGTVSELRQHLDLREAVAVTGDALRVRLDPESLAAWAEGKAVMPGPLWRGVAVLLSLAAAAALMYGIQTLSFRPVLAILLVEGFIWRWLRRQASAVNEAVNCNGEGLELFSEILARLEKERFTSSQLQAFVAELTSGAEPASRAIRRLARIVYWIDSCEGLFAKLLNVPALYAIQVGFAAEAWRSRFGPKLRRWVEITAEMEALLSLSAYSFEHPADPFPEFTRAGATDALFDGAELGHPLIPASASVANSVRLDAQTRVLLVSGSNMSGKSTLLRTVGVNAVLAMAGAPIRGKSLRLSPLFLGSRIRSTDSLLENRSNFYTEILRIRRVFEWTGREWPLLFLFDELLEGTNSKDRRIGAEGLLQELLARQAIGLVSTHDLALTEITRQLGSAVHNMHFQDYIENGEMRFDYKLREGIVAKSNALELMRLIGLKI